MWIFWAHLTLWHHSHWNWVHKLWRIGNSNVAKVWNVLVQPTICIWNAWNSHASSVIFLVFFPPQLKMKSALLRINRRGIFKLTIALLCSHISIKELSQLQGKLCRHRNWKSWDPSWEVPLLKISASFTQEINVCLTQRTISFYIFTWNCSLSQFLLQF